MKQIYKLSLAMMLIFLSGTSIAQISVIDRGNEMNFGKFLGCYLQDAFTYDGQIMPHYGMKWYWDSHLTGAPTFALSGYGGLKFFTSGGLKLFVDVSGNVGIGTESPGNKLDVNGTIRAKEVRVESGWADFVFDKEYNLQNLSEVELFINEHKHLPDVPDAKSVEKNGVNLGEMNALLLKKIEELTLYSIDQNKNLKEQAKKIEILEKAMNILISK